MRLTLRVQYPLVINKSLLAFKKRAATWKQPLCHPNKHNPMSTWTKMNGKKRKNKRSDPLQRSARWVMAQ